MKERGFKEQLTNELLRKQFSNSFQLAHQVINLGRFYVKAGHEIHLDKLLEEIRKNPSPDYVHDLEALEKAEEEEGTEE